MRILVLAPQPFFTVRGTPIAVRLLLEALAARGHQLDVLIFADGEDIEIEGCTFTRIPALPGLRGVRPGFSVKKAICDVVMAKMAVWKLLRHRYDVIHAVEEAAWIARRLKALFRVPFVYDLDSSIPAQIAEKYTLPGWADRFLKREERRALTASVAALCCCPALEAIAREQAPDLPVRTLEDISLLDGALVPQEAPDEPPEDVVRDDPVVMYVGNLEHYQGVGLLLDAFALAVKRCPMRLAIVGGSDGDIAEYRVRAEALGIGERVQFLGPRPIARLAAYLSAARVVVSPRLVGINTPMKVYSYLDSGRPLLATDLPTHTQVLDPGFCHLVAPTPEAMAEGLVELVENPELAARLAEAARARVRRDFSQAAFVRKLAEFYETDVLPRLGKRG